MRLGARDTGHASAARILEHDRVFATASNLFARTAQGGFVKFHDVETRSNTGSIPEEKSAQRPARGQAVQGGRRDCFS